MSDHKLEVPATVYVIRGPPREPRELVYDVCSQWCGKPCERKCPVQVPHPPECVVRAQRMIALVRGG